MKISKINPINITISSQDVIFREFIEIVNATNKSRELISIIVQIFAKCAQFI